jgi:hypothetical protein
MISRNGEKYKLIIQFVTGIDYLMIRRLYTHCFNYKQLTIKVAKLMYDKGSNTLNYIK